MYWGMWRGKDGKAQIASYAASMEDNLNTEKIESILKLLPNFDFISVREKHIAQKLSPFTNKNIHIVIDPTLLINREEWLHLGTMRLLQENYVLLYQVRNDEKTVEIAKKIADKKGVRLVYLSARVDLLNSKETIGSGPEEFVSLFRHACFVVCTSFHGTVFSCIFHVPFYSVLLDDGKDNRVKNLLSEIKLEKRGISSYPEEVEENIDWKDVDKQISDLQQSSYKYLNTFC